MRRPGVAHQVLDAEAVLFDPQSGRTHRMNETALSIWRSCDGTTTARQLAEYLTGNYDVPFQSAIEDVEQVVAAFAHADLLTAAENE
jgi:PqqD family protein of HPr-rel-A system